MHQLIMRQLLYIVDTHSRCRRLQKVLWTCLLTIYGWVQVRAIARAREDIGRVEGRPMADAESMLAMLDRIAIVDFARDQAGLEDVFGGVDAVVACFCSRQHWMDRVGGSAMTATVAAMEAKGVRRLIFLSSMGIAEDWPPMPVSRREWQAV